MHATQEFETKIGSKLSGSLGRGMKQNPYLPLFAPSIYANPTSLSPLFLSHYKTLTSLFLQIILFFLLLLFVSKFSSFHFCSLPAATPDYSFEKKNMVSYLYRNVVYIVLVGRTWLDVRVQPKMYDEVDDEQHFDLLLYFLIGNLCFVWVFGFDQRLGSNVYCL